MPLIQKAKTGTGNFVQVVGYLIWIGCGLYIFIYEIGVINDAFGFWLAALAFILAPIVYGFAFFIDWIITGVFPLGIFILWLVSWVGLAIVALGASIKGAQKMGWVQRHLNWTWLFTYLIWIPINYSESTILPIIGAIFLLLVSGWVIKQKGRSLWWILLTIVFSPLWLKNITRKLEQTPMTELSTDELLTLKEKYITDESTVSIVDDELATRAKDTKE